MDLVQDQDDADARASTPALVDFLKAPVRLQTYRNLAYLALQFPLGITYFVTLVTAGATAFAGLTILLEALPNVLGDVPAAGVTAVPLVVAVVALIGIAAGLLAVGGVGLVFAGVGLFTVDRLVTGAVLGRSLPASPVAGSLRENPLGVVRSLFATRGPYLATLAAAAKFPLGVLTFVVTLVPATLAFVFLLAPLVYDSPDSTYQFSTPEAFQISYLDGFYTVDYRVVLGSTNWTVDTFPEALGLAVVGLGLVFVTLNAFNVLAWALGRATGLVARHASVFVVDVRGTGRAD